MINIVRLPVRVLVFLVGFIACWFEVAADWLIGARGKTEYVREGRCHRCGRCCRCLALVMPPGVSSRSSLVRAARAWHAFAMNFRYIAEEDGGEEAGRRSWLIYRCGYYRDGVEGDPGRCSIYPVRHRICRFFPRQKLYGHPSLHPDCGFRFVRRVSRERKRTLEHAGRPTFDDILGSKT